MKSSAALVIFLLLAPASLAFAANAWQPGVLTRTRSTVTGNACSRSTQSDAAAYGNTARPTLDASARCSDVRGAVYTVRAGGRDYELTPDHSRAARASSYLPLSAAFLHPSSLANRMPGTAVELRAEGDAIFVRVAGRESQYRLYTAAP